MENYENEQDYLPLFYNEPVDTNDEETEEELAFDLSKNNQAVIWGTDWTTETIARQLEKGVIDLNPSFQRRDAWTDIEKSKLIESLILGFPVPPIILAESRLKKNTFIVIDGKQRLLSIRRFYAGSVPDSSASSKSAFKVLRLKGLEILKSLNKMSYSDVRTQNDDYINSLDNQSIRTVVIKNWPDEAFLYTVFLRLNTGSKKLSPQELRQALHPGKFLTYLDEATARSKTIQSVLHNVGPDPRMKDIEITLRYFAYKFYPNKYDGNLKEFLDLTCKELNQNWAQEETHIYSLFSELEQSIQYMNEIFNPHSAFLRYEKGQPIQRFNRAVFEVFTYFFSIPEIRIKLLGQGIDFKSKYISINDDFDFSSAVSETTKTVNRVLTRYNKVGDIIASLLKESDRYLVPRFSQAGNHILVNSSLI